MPQIPAHSSGGARSSRNSDNGSRNREHGHYHGKYIERQRVRSGRLAPHRKKQRPDSRGHDGQRLRRTLNASEMRTSVRPSPERKEDDHDEATGDAHRDGLYHHLRNRRHVRERRESGGEYEERRDQDGTQ